MSDEKDNNIIRLAPKQPEGRTYERTLIDGGRRYTPNACAHKGPYIIDRKLAAVECGDCGALLNPIYVLEVLACQEAYWNMRRRDLSEYLKVINAEIEGRSRTRCVHCQNMTPIKFKAEMPRTWMPEPY